MATKTQIKSRLKKAQKAWDEGRKQAAESGFDIPDGNYIVKLTGASVVESKSSGNLQVAWTWKVLKGRQTNKQIMSFNQLQTETNLMWLARDLDKLGYEAPGDLVDLPELLDEAVEEGITARVAMVTSGEYQNLRLQNLIDPDDLDELDDEDEEDVEDDDSDSDDEEDDEDDDGEETEEEEGDEEEEDEEADDENEWSVGDLVDYEWDGEPYQGVITELGEDAATIETDGEECDIPYGEFTLADGGEEEGSDGEEDKLPRSKKKRGRKTF